MIFVVADQRPAKRLRSSDQVDEENPMIGVSIFTFKVAPNFISGTGGKIFQHTPPKPLAQVGKTVQQILERHLPTIQKLVADAGTTPLIPSWIPKIDSDCPKEMAFTKHIKTLAIPAVEGLPSLLLHDLHIEVDEKPSKHIADIFSLNHHTCVDDCNSSRFALC
jgi:hypothetical protein